MSDQKQPLSRAVLDATLANMFSSPTYQRSYLFYAHLVAQCSILLEEMKAPAAVSFQLDHYCLHINPLLFDKYTLEQRLFILQHEMHHILNGHVHRAEDRIFKSWNYATDCAINQLGNPAHMPSGLIVPTSLPSKVTVSPKLSSEMYYELIDHDQIPPDDDTSGHSKWGDSAGDSDLQSDITKNMIERAINDTQKSRGDVPSEIANYLELFGRKSELNWKRILKNIVSNKKANTRRTIMRRDRRNPNFEHIKGKTKDRTFTLGMIGDVSGSVSDDELSGVLIEALAICKQTNTASKFVQVDSRAYPPEDFTKSTKTFKRRACGGTYLSPALDMFKDHNIKVDAYLVCTDGELSHDDVAKFTATGKRVIWLITSRGSIMPEMNNQHMVAIKLKA